MKVRILAATVLTAMLGAQYAQAEDNTEKKTYEKCYGIAKAGKNDCSSRDGKSACAGRSVKDNEQDRWIYVPKGLCNKIVGGSTV